VAFQWDIAGNAGAMSDERADRRPTDEPDGTPAYAASLRSPGDSVRTAATRDVTDEEVAADAAPAGDAPVVDQPGDGVERGAGYDTDAVSGDTDMYRPA
jgi:hypothetical protein